MKLAGILFILMGALALLFPFIAGIATELLIGAAFVIAGAGHVIDTYSQTHLENRPSHFALGALFVIGGALLLLMPIAGIAAFTLLIAASFLLQGATQGYLALIDKTARNRAWMLLSAVIAVVAGSLIIGGWPSSALWLVGVIIGIDFLFLGIALLTTRIEVLEASVDL